VFCSTERVDELEEPSVAAPHFSSSLLGRYHSISFPFQEQVAVTSKLSSSTHNRRQVAPSEPSDIVQEVEKVFPSALELKV